MKTIKLEELQSLDQPGDGWYHIEPAGVHPHQMKYKDDYKTVSSVINDETITRIVEAGLPEEGVFIDRDHLSLDTRDTEAMGWVRDLAGFWDDEGVLQLAGLIEWTDLGMAAIEGKRYKKFSTEFDMTDDAWETGELYPTQLVGLALTNRPNNPGQRGITSTASTQDFAGCKSPATQEPNQAENTIMVDLKKIAGALGLVDDATEEEILAEIARSKEAEDAAADAEAETLLSSEGVKDLPDEEKEDLKEMIKSNKPAALRLINRLRSNRGVKPTSATPRYALATIGSNTTSAR